MHLRDLLASLLVGTALAGCNVAPNSAGQISERIGQIANDPTSNELDLAKLTSFGWDRLFFFRAGTTRDEICKFLNSDRDTCRSGASHRRVQLLLTWSNNFDPRLTEPYLYQT